MSRRWWTAECGYRGKEHFLLGSVSIDAKLIARIEKHRGRAAAAELHEEMRRQ